MRTSRVVAVIAIAASMCVGGLSTGVANASSTVDIASPTGAVNWGSSVFVLHNGNFVVTNPAYNVPAANTGAVYLYDGATHDLISKLTGSSGLDQVGSSGIVELTNGNFVVLSPSWSDGVSAKVGAVTWVNGTTGLSGAVSGTNSIVGSHTADQVGNGLGVTALTNGNYVVGTYLWDNGGTADVGAATWAKGDGSTHGPVTTTNSLYGSTAGDSIGVTKAVALSNGNYAVGSSLWANSGLVDAGAIAWGDGLTGTSGAVTTSNSLYGTTAHDGVGSTLIPLSGPAGNYVVESSGWDGTAVDEGAVTWRPGNSVSPTAVTAANSLHGTTASDLVGIRSIQPLTDGNYVVPSDYWDGVAANVGAVTWANGSTGTSGAVTTANSLVGSQSGDSVGSKGITALANGNYVVLSPQWRNGSATAAGAATFGAHGGTNVGAVTSANSLVGTALNDRVGFGGATPLTGGAYVVDSPTWSAGIGAATWAAANGSTVGPVTSANSLVGSSPLDQVASTPTTALSNGNFVVDSPLWDNASAADAGAVTFGNGATGAVGTVSAANSLVGTTAGDRVGARVSAMTDGSYVVASDMWSNGVVPHVGAVVHANGASGVAGAVTPANSLIGNAAGDRVGDGVIAVLPNGVFSFTSSFFAVGLISNAGAVTFAGPGTLLGRVDGSNSLVGTTANDVGAVAPGGFTTDGSLVVGRSVAHLVTLYKRDFSPPFFSITPSNVTAVAAPGATHAIVTFSTPAASDDVGAPSVACSPSSGSDFPLGSTTVTCTATNTEGLSATTAFTVTVSIGRDYTPLTPARLADTRLGFTTVDGLFAGTGTVAGGTVLELPVAGRGGVATNAVAATLNVTVTAAAAAGFVTVFPCGDPQPTASSLNYSAGSTVPNAVVTKLGGGGKACLFASQPLDLIVDVNGAFPPETTYVPINPARLIDTRADHTTSDGAQQGGGVVGPASVTTLQITGRAGIPGDATAVVVNLTVTEPTAAGYATVYPCGTQPPTASNLNYVSGETVPNLVVAKIGANGAICIFSQQTTQLVADVTGYFPASTTFVALVPARLLDTRAGFATIDGSAAGAGIQPTGTVTVVHVAGRGGVPSGATTAVLNVTVTDPAAAGYVTIYPCGIDPPLASNLNFATGQTVPNAVLSKIGTNGDVCIFNSQPTNLITDVTGYFS